MTVMNVVVLMHVHHLLEQLPGDGHVVLVRLTGMDTGHFHTYYLTFNCELILHNYSHDSLGAMQLKQIADHQLTMQFGFS